MRPLTFIHAADLHLDSPFKGMEANVPPVLFERMKESTFRSFARVIDRAVQERVDFVVLSGDLYDAQTRSLRAQIFVRDQLRRLHDYSIPVYVIHGNHDHLGGNWAAIEFPDNVHIFTESYVERKPYYRDGELMAYIYGFSYHQKAVTENMTNQYKKEKGAPFHIGLLHGSLDGNSEHGRYAPFLLSELLEKNFDYWALGHIHKRSILSEQPPIIYPGNIQGRHRKETGEKGCYLVKLELEASSQVFIPTADILWNEIEVSIEGVHQADELLERCYEAMNSVRRENEGVLVSLTFSGYGVMSPYLQDAREELVHILQSGEERENFVYIVKCNDKTLSRDTWEQMKKEHHFFGALLKEAEQFKEIDGILRPLWASSAARELEMFSAEEKQEILKEAERIVIQGLMAEEADKR
ncbi:metallophosphoesterase family protein [Ectobacillus panaciterrae]|uniref:metallophosphoesterase family protein n=1 Tax=Ectobacillus panaciterrae TaxID=363872 RepID=UPI000418F706|nr:DNA repair exonuclease [Ectobacillus panaciterrae]